MNMAYSDVPVLDNNGDITEYMPTLTVEGYGQIGRLNDYSSMGLARDNGDENHILDMFFSPGWSEVEVLLKIVG